jgi:hypothetical protein
MMVAGVVHRWFRSGNRELCIVSRCMSVLLPARVLFAHDSDAGNEVKTPLCQILVVGVLFEVVDWTVGVSSGSRQGL